MELERGWSEVRKGGGSEGMETGGTPKFHALRRQPISVAPYCIAFGSTPRNSGIGMKKGLEDAPMRDYIERYKEFQVPQTPSNCPSPIKLYPTLRNAGIRLTANP